MTGLRFGHGLFKPVWIAWVQARSWGQACPGNVTWCASARAAMDSHDGQGEGRESPGMDRAARGLTWLGTDVIIN